MTPRLFLLAMLTLATATNSPAFGSDVYKAIPSDSLGFLIIHRIGETSGRLTKTAQQAQIPMPPLLMMVQQMTGVTQLDEAESAAAIVLPGETPADEPRVAILAPTKDYPKLLAGLGPDDPKATIAHVMVAGSPSIVAKKGAFAVFMGDEDADLAAMQKLLDARADIGGVVKPLKKWLDGQEIGAVVMPEGMGLFFDKMEAALAAKAEGLGPEQEAPVKLVADIVKSLQREVSHFAVGLRVDGSGTLDLTTRGIFLPAGAFVRAAKDAATPDSDIFAGLPAGPYALAGSGALPESWADPITDLWLQMAGAGLSADLSDEQHDNMAQATRQLMKGLRGVSLVMKAPKPNEPLYSGLMGFMRVKSSERYLAEQKKSNDAIGKQRVQGAVYEFAMKDVEGFPGMEMTVSSGEDAASPEAAVHKMVLDKMLGPDGKTYIAAINPTTIAMSYVKPAGIPLLAKQLKTGAGLTSDQGIKKTAMLLPTGCQWTAYASPAGCVTLARNAVQLLAPAAQPQPNIPDFPASPPIGLTAKLLPIGLETHLVVPSDTVSAIGAYVLQVRGGAQQQQ